MSTVTVQEVTERLYQLTPDQLSAVNDLLVSLTRYSRVPESSPTRLEERPITSPEALRFGFWPEDESLDEFLQARDSWRRQDIALEAATANV